MEGHRCTWISVEMVLFVLSTLAFEGKYVYGTARESDEFLDGKFLLLHHSFTLIWRVCASKLKCIPIWNYIKEYLPFCIPLNSLDIEESKGLRTVDSNLELKWCRRGWGKMRWDEMRWDEMERTHTYISPIYFHFETMLNDSRRRIKSAVW